MRFLPATLLALGCLASSEAEAAKGSIISSAIDMSEWGPPARLTVDLDDGRYAVTPPSEHPPALISTQARSGRLVGESLRKLRTAFDDAIKTGLIVKGCEQHANPRDAYIAGNGGLQSMQLTYEGKKITTSKFLQCWTEPTLGLTDVLNQLFDHRAP